MKSVTVLILLFASNLFGQYKPPSTCKPGDLIDGYTGSYLCVAANVWVDSKHANFGSQGEWVPACQWAFKDKSDTWHCPYETASGMVVGFIPCKDTAGVRATGSVYDHSKAYYDNRQDCSKWEQVTQRRIQLMHTGRTVQSEQGDPKNVQDHTDPKVYTCPDQFELIVLQRYNSSFIADETICWAK